MVRTIIFLAIIFCVESSLADSLLGQIERKISHSAVQKTTVNLFSGYPLNAFYINTGSMLVDSIGDGLKVVTVSIPYEIGFKSEFMAELVDETFKYQTEEPTNQSGSNVGVVCYFVDSKKSGCVRVVKEFFMELSQILKVYLKIPLVLSFKSESDEIVVVKNSFIGAKYWSSGVAVGNGLLLNVYFSKPVKGVVKVDLLVEDAKKINKVFVDVVN